VRQNCSFINVGRCRCVRWVGGGDPPDFRGLLLDTAARAVRSVFLGRGKARSFVLQDVCVEDCRGSVQKAAALCRSADISVYEQR
jgi:hypothetical protein